MKQTIVFTFGAWSIIRFHNFSQVSSRAKWSVYFNNKFYCSHKTKKNCIEYIQNMEKVFA